MVAVEAGGVAMGAKAMAGDSNINEAVKARTVLVEQCIALPQGFASSWRLRRIRKGRSSRDATRMSRAERRPRAESRARLLRKRSF